MCELRYVPLVALAVLFSSVFAPGEARAKGQDASVEILGNAITVRTEIVIYGRAATAALAKEIQAQILADWATDSRGTPWTYVDPATKKLYTVAFDVNVSLYRGKEKQAPRFIPDAWNPWSRRNYVECVDTEFRSRVYYGDKGKWYANPFPNHDYSHEFGHLIGLRDRYQEDENGKSFSIPGWEGNIMADSSWGRVEQKNVDAVAKQVLARYRYRQTYGWPTPPGEKFRDAIDNPSNRH